MQITAIFISSIYSWSFSKSRIFLSFALKLTCVLGIVYVYMSNTHVNSMILEFERKNKVCINILYELLNFFIIAKVNFKV